VQPTSAVDTDVAIETPEHIVFRYRVAGPARRFVAYLIDLLVCYGVLALAAFLVLLASVGAVGAAGAAQNLLGAGVGLLLVLLFAAQWVYFAAFETAWGRTPGKAAMALRVVLTDGRPIGLRAAVLRNVLRAADSLPLTYSAGCLSVAGLAAMCLTRRFQRLGDLVAGTMVIGSERVRPAAPIVLSPPLQPSEHALVPEHVRLDPDERQAIEMFLRRRGALGRARELELAAMIAPLLCARLGASDAAAASLSDPSRTVALFYDRAAGTAGPASRRPPKRWR
jgi:uncharacterized RDD family membrane protein YckC